MFRRMLLSDKPLKDWELWYFDPSARSVSLAFLHVCYFLSVLESAATACPHRPNALWKRMTRFPCTLNFPSTLIHFVCNGGMR
jgi:hypothetical protein